MNFYERLQSAYGWTVKEIDDTDACVLLDQLVVLAKRNVRTVYIEDVMG